MKSLPNVTLISYDNSATPQKTLKALQYCATLMDFAEVILVCNRRPSQNNGTKLISVREQGYKDAMIWEVGGVADHVQTDFALCIHYDGFIVNPDKWTDEWLQYDFIGSPWPAAWHPGKGRVGNTGFCLKSKAFMHHSKTFLPHFDPKTARNYGTGTPGDMFVCCDMRPALEALGMKFAPVNVAADFAWECNIEEFPLGRPDAFGFHNFSGKTVPQL